MLAWMLMAAQPALPSYGVEDDIRCTAVLATALEAARSESERASLTGAMMYFVGRIEGASPATDLPAAVDKAKAVPLTEAARNEARLRCGLRLLERNKVFAAFDPNVARIEEVR